ncbi:MAG TPA: hypothetical protein VJG90_02050 [Candidatus Nanoarchaeia archaeon]|nr:hypothetical protein [Candidatus Nanoarchaeia archaeon]
MPTKSTEPSQEVNEPTRGPTSLKINPEVWQAVREHCVKKQYILSGYVESLIIKDLNLEVKPSLKRRKRKQP